MEEEIKPDNMPHGFIKIRKDTWQKGSIMVLFKYNNYQQKDIAYVFIVGDWAKDAYNANGTKTIENLKQLDKLINN